jgi:DNA-binding XRE family transcriptional regulator
MRHYCSPESAKRDVLYINTKSIKYMPRKSILKVSIRQIKAARALLGLSQEQLAEVAEISLPTIKRLEAIDGPVGGRSETGKKIQLALERAGVEFIDENGGGPGVRIQKSGKKTPK